MSSLDSGRLFVPPPANVTRLFLIRHGSTEPNERRPFVLQGCEIDGPLTELGRRQANAVATFLASLNCSAIYVSPMLRARETADSINRFHRVPVETKHDLRECSVGQWEGLSWDQIRERDPHGADRFQANPAEVRHPNGESYRDLLTRISPALSSILSHHRGHNVVVVAHNMVNRVFLADLLGVELRHARRIRQANCCVNVLQQSDASTDVMILNSTWHLDGI